MVPFALMLLALLVPPSLPRPRALVAVTGVCEFVGAVGLLVPVAARLAAYGLIALLVAMFPAHIRAARARLSVGGRPATPLAIRVPLQLVWIGLLWWSVQPQ